MRRGRQISERTLAMCAEYERRLAAGQSKTEIVRDLAASHDVQRPAIWKALRAGGAVPPYRPKREGSQGRPIGGGQPGYTAQRQRKAADTAAAAEDKIISARQATIEPCGRCGVRADVGGKHRPAEGPPPIAVTDTRPPPDGRRAPRPGAGLNFHLRKRDRP